MNNKLKVLICGSTVVFASWVSASGKPGTAAAMNGIVASQFGNFAATWTLVTVRFRKDTGEMRFVYANPQAEKALEAKIRDYPDGAVFAKIAIRTQDDPAFPSSAEPSGTRRTQFMVRDHRKYAQTNGWGYAIFDADGHIYPGDLGDQTKACFACHQIVKDRGDVFSRSLHLSVWPKKTREAWRESLSFASVEAKSLPSRLRKILPAGTARIRLLQGKVTGAVFSGTLDEIRPLLAREALGASTAAALVSDDQTQFSVVFPDGRAERAAKCGAHQMALRAYQTVADKNKPLFELEFCQDRKR
jgi:hypothetical protein